MERLQRPRTKTVRRLLCAAWAVTLAFALMVGACLWLSYDTPAESTLMAKTLTFTEMERTLFGSYALTDGETTYTIRLDLAERAAFSQAVDAGATFQALVEATPGGEEGRIWHIADSAGHTYLTFSRAMEKERNEGWQQSGFLAAIPLLCWTAAAVVMNAARRGGGAAQLGRRTRSKGRKEACEDAKD